jgi:hypothetical protein
MTKQMTRSCVRSLSGSQPAANQWVAEGPASKARQLKFWPGVHAWMWGWPENLFVATVGVAGTRSVWCFTGRRTRHRR